MGLHEFCDLFHHLGLVHLIGQLRDNNGFPIGLFVRLHLHLGPHDHHPSAGGVGIMDAISAIYHTRSGKIGPRNMGHNFRNGNGRVIQKGNDGVGHLVDIVGRNIGGHPNGNTRRAIDQKRRQPGGHHRGFFHGFIVIGDPVHGLFFKVSQHLMGHFFHADFSVPHGCRGITIHGTKISLAIHQGIAHGKILGHADNGVIHRRVAVGMILTNDITHHTGGFLIRFIPVVVQLTHGKKHPAMNRFEAIPDIGKGPADDDAHGIFEIGLLHLLLDACHIVVLVYHSLSL